MRKKHIVVLATSSLLIIGGIAAGTRHLTREVYPFVKQNAQRVVVAGSVHQSDHLEFDWSLYEDPSRPEFWDDGDGAPPRPLRHLAAHPTKENAERVKRWLALQIEVIAKVGKLLNEDSKAPSPLLSSLEGSTFSNSLIKKVSMDGEPEQRLDNVRIVNLYRAGCSACQKSKDTIKRLEEAGAQILHVQTDFGKLPALYEGSREYTKEFQDHFAHEVTPTLFIKIEGKEPEMIEGYVDFETLHSHLVDLLGDTDDKK